MAGANLRLVATGGIPARPRTSLFDTLALLARLFLAVWFIGGMVAMIFGGIWVLKISIESISAAIGVTVP